MAELIGRRPNRRLRHQRQLRGWTLDDVADGLHRLADSAVEVGVDAHMVGRWERGFRRPSPRYVGLLCRLFERAADELGLVEEPPDVPAADVASLLRAWSSTPRMSMTVAGCTNQCWVEA